MLAYFRSRRGLNFAESQVDYYNVRLDWTLNIDVAFGLEYRHRGRFDWRKADFYNLSRVDSTY